MKRDNVHHILSPLTLSIRWRLTLWYLLILSLVLFAFGGIVYATQASSIRSSLNSELANDVNTLASSYDPANGQFDISTNRPRSLLE